MVFTWTGRADWQIANDDDSTRSCGKLEALKAAIQTVDRPNEILWSLESANVYEKSMQEIPLVGRAACTHCNLHNLDGTGPKD